MTKSQLIETIAARAPHVPRPQVEGIVNAVFDAMAGALRRGQRIEIRGFGSLSVKVRPARTGRNPKTGQQVFVPERRTLNFVCGKELRERLNPPTAAPPEPRVAAPVEREHESLPAAAVVSASAAPRESVTQAG
jgi:integration host factor subunit beta